MKTVEKNSTEISVLDLEQYNKFPKLKCNKKRTHVFHGVKEEGDIQTVVCLSCGDTYKFHIDGRNKIEKSLWEKFQRDKDKVNLTPAPVKRPKKRWSRKFLIFRGKK